jgi:hypothetical protein
MSDGVQAGQDQVGEGLRTILDAINDPASRIDLGPPEPDESGNTKITVQISSAQES